MDRHGTFLMAWLAVSEVVPAVWVLTAALAAVLEVVAAAGVGVGVCDMVMAGGRSGCKGRGWAVFWGGQGCFVECMTRSEECICAASRNGVSWALDGSCVSFTACWRVSGIVGTSWVLATALDTISGVVVAAFTAGGWVSRVSGAICVPDGALDAVSEAVAAVNVGGGGCDMVTAMGHSGHGGRG
jgi:hypothetical protein